MKSIILRLKKISIGSIVAGSALFISACALFLSIQEIRIMRVQQEATMYPYLTIGGTYTKDGFGVELKNSGNGLAKINSYKIFLNNAYFKDWQDVVNTAMPEAKNINYSLINTSGNIRNQMISPGESKTLIFIKWTDETRILEKRLQNMKVKICYESMLKD